jgi:enoyl reductase-like protein
MALFIEYDARIPSAVFNQEGPAASKWPVKKDEPMKELLVTIHEALIQLLLGRECDTSSVRPLSLALSPHRHHWNFLEASEWQPITPPYFSFPRNSPTLRNG